MIDTATKKTSIIASFSNSLLTAMKSVCERTGENRSELLRRAVRELLDRECSAGSVTR